MPPIGDDVTAADYPRINHSPDHGLAPDNWDEQVDLLILGSGAGGLSAAVTGANEGLSVLVLEKTDFSAGRPPTRQAPVGSRTTASSGRPAAATTPRSPAAIWTRWWATGLRARSGSRI